jgi:putative DNA primase/helicase
MEREAFEGRVAAVKRRAHGRWTELLMALGVDEHLLNRRNQPCPLCGGKDRFQYTDRFGEGNYHCRGCGAGGGLKLAQACLQIGFAELLARLEGLLGTMTSTTAPSAEGPSAGRMKALCQRIWHEAGPVRPGDAVDRYLSSRGLQLAAYPKTLRCHPALGYYESDGAKSTKVGEYPAMLACVQGPDGRGVTLHRTYLEAGRQLAGRAAKKLLSGGIAGGAVRLREATDELCVCEGIETGLAVLIGTGLPVWSALGCANLEKLWLPESVARVRVYADNDADGDFDGQASAYVLARRLKKEPRAGGNRHVEVHVPRSAGTDFADVWLQRLPNARLAA